MKQLFTALMLLLATHTFSQLTGVLPLTGLTYTRGGLGFKEITVSLDESTWISNRLPINKTFEIKVVEPWGLKAVDGSYFPGIEVAFLAPDGDTLGHVDNLFDESFEGMSDFQLSNLSLELGFNEQSHPGDTVDIRARFFDSKGTAQLFAKLVVIIAEPELPLEITAWINWRSSTDGYNCSYSGVDMDNLDVRIDSLSGAVEVLASGLNVMTEEAFNEGKLQVWEYNEKNQPVVLNDSSYSIQKEPLQLDGKPAMDALFRVLPPPAGGTRKAIRIRWESPDHLRVLDFVYTN